MTDNSSPFSGEKTSVVTFALLCLLLILALYSVLFSALTSDFASATEFYVFGYDAKTCCMAHPESWHMVGMGRYLGSLIHNLIFMTIDRLEDFRSARLASFALMAVNASALMAMILWLTRMRASLAAGLTLAIILLPGFIGGVVEQAVAPMNIYNMPVVLASFALWHAAGRRDPEKARGLFPAVPLVLLSAALLVASLTIYQPFAPFFLSLALIRHLFAPPKDATDAWFLPLRDIAFFASVALGYFLVHRYVVLPFLIEAHPQLAIYTTGTGNMDVSQYQFNMATDLGAKLSQWHDIASQVVGMWSLNSYSKMFNMSSEGLHLFATVVLVTCGLVVAALVMRRFLRGQPPSPAARHGETRSVAAGIALILGGAILAGSTFGVVLVPKGDVSYNPRSLIPSMAALAAIGIWSMAWLSQLALVRTTLVGVRFARQATDVVIAITMLFVGLAAREHVDVVVASMRLNLDSMVEKAHKFAPEVQDKVSIVYPVLPFFVEKEYPLRIDYSYGLVQQIMRQSGVHLKTVPMVGVEEVISYRLKQDRYFAPQKTFILSEIDPVRPNKAFEGRPDWASLPNAVHLHFLTATPARISGLTGLFDQRGGPTFEATPASWPLVVEDRMAGAAYRDLTEYGFLADGDEPLRMPMKWELLGARGEEEWTRLDVRDETGRPFKANEWRRFALSGKTVQGQQFDRFRLVIHQGFDPDIIRIKKIEIR